MPQAYEYRKGQSPVRTSSPELNESVHKSTLDPDSCTSMVERLYTPDIVRKRRLAAEAQAAMERRNGYDATQDVHLANFWARQRHVKSTVRCFAKNAPRSATPNVTMVSTTVSHHGAHHHDLPPIRAHTTAGTPPTRAARRDRHPAAGADDDMAQPESPYSSIQSSQSRSSWDGTPRTSSSRGTTPASSAAQSPVAAGRDGDDGAGDTSTLASPQATMDSAEPSPAKSGAADTTYGDDYEDDYEDDFQSPGTSAAPSPAKSAASPKKPSAASPKKDPAVAPSPEPGSADGRSPEHQAVTRDPSPAPAQANEAHDASTSGVLIPMEDEGSTPRVRLSEDDVAVLCMLAAPSLAHAASVRRLRLHDGVNLAWIGQSGQPPPRRVTLLDIPLECPGEGASQPPGSSAPSQTPVGDEEGAPDPNVEQQPAENGNLGASVSSKDDGAKRPRGGASSSKPRRQTSPERNPSISSPRSAHILLRSGVAPKELWPTTRSEFYRVNVNQGVSRVVLRHRFHMHEASRQATLRRLQREYTALCATLSTEDVIAQVQQHRDDGLNHDPNADVSMLPSRGKRRPPVAGDSPYAAKQTLGAARPGSSRTVSTDAAGPRGKLSAGELHQLRQQRLRGQFERMVGIERAKTESMVELHRREIACDEALRQRREVEAEERLRKARERDAKIKKTQLASVQLHAKRVERNEATVQYSEARSAYQQQLTSVQRLAEKEHKRAVRAERERLVQANERQLEFEKLCVLHHVQAREAAVNHLMHERDVVRNQMREERRKQDAELKAASAKLKADLLEIKRKGLNTKGTDVAKATPKPRAASALA